MTAQTEKVLVGPYQIPGHLVYLTGCPAESFESYGAAQFGKIQSTLNITPDDHVMEIGCGVGRLAIPASKFLSRNGSYVGLDIIRESIDWCNRNISPKYPNFRFVHEDVRSQIHNPYGMLQSVDVRLPSVDESVDRIFMSSVFTHMMPLDIMHYLSEIRRVLRPSGAALSTMFLLTHATREMIRRGLAQFTFAHRFLDYSQCMIENPSAPEGAVAYDESAYLLMLRANGLALRKPVELGSWSGCGGPAADGQDYVVFGRA